MKALVEYLALAGVAKLLEVGSVLLALLGEEEMFAVDVWLPCSFQSLRLIEAQSYTRGRNVLP